MSNNRLQDKNIHWYPGHMAKALKEIEAKIKFVDVIVELVDARAPSSTRNPFLAAIAPNKQRLIILNKADLSDPKVTKKWLDYLSKSTVKVLALDLTKPSSRTAILAALQALGSAKWERNLARGLKKQPIRALIAGIPNVGKSTLINKLVSRKATKVANKPGQTRALQYVKVNDLLELLDTPGVLPPFYEDPNDAVNLAMIGSIPSEILPLEKLGLTLIDFLKVNYPLALQNRYGVKVDTNFNAQLLLGEISRQRGYFKPEDDNYARAIQTVLKEFQDGVLGPISLEDVPNVANV